MSSQSAHASSCVFPKLLERQANKGIERILSVEIEVDSLKTLENVLDSDPTDFSLTLRTCWALVLRCYTGLNSVCFAHEEEAGNADSQLSAFSANIDPSARLRDLRDQANMVLAGVDPKVLWKEVNTAVLIRKVAGVGQLQKAAKTAVSSQVTKSLCAVCMSDAQLNIRQCHLRLHVKLLRGSVRMFLDHWTGAVSSSSARSIASTFALVLNQIMNQPDRRVEDLYHLSTRDKTQLMAWNGSAPIRVERLIHEVILDQVATNAEAEAVCSWDGSFTYATLDRASSALASRLRHMGVGPEVFVPLAFAKSKWNIVAMLAVLKAGGACMYTVSGCVRTVYVNLGPSRSFGPYSSYRTPQVSCSVFKC
jgi:hypothetical protein